MAVKLFRVLYDFKAEEEGELSVKAGQLVQLKGELATSSVAQYVCRCATSMI